MFWRREPRHMHKAKLDLVWASSLPQNPFERLVQVENLNHGNRFNRFQVSQVELFKGAALVGGVPSVRR